MRNIIIDCDPGHDDAIALLVALANPEKLNLLAVTTIGGNQTLEKVTKNAKNILAYVNANVPLAMGQEGPLVKPLHTAPEAHGDSGMDGPYFKENDYPIVSDNAVFYMYQTIMAQAERVTLVGLGPLTNIALLLKTFPDVKSKIEMISIMGGGIRRGNMTAAAEFNIYVDPEAAKIVFTSGLPIVMSGLDVTEKAFVTIEEINALENGREVHQLVYELLKFYNESGKQFGFEHSPIHDLCAVSYLVDPTMFSGKHYHVDVVTDDGTTRGMTLADRRLKPAKEQNVFVLEDINREAYVHTLLQALARLDKM
ncbi:nucleoside hydrolase [Sporosarcina sp. NPDC096371]|uniref:nucleoside hydrolase n=1 Tax=Sporosarcina sp. NPDC096371 TaxID=3364530 RepID=UPI0038218C94